MVLNGVDVAFALRWHLKYATQSFDLVLPRLREVIDGFGYEDISFAPRGPCLLAEGRETKDAAPTNGEVIAASLTSDQERTQGSLINQEHSAGFDGGLSPLFDHLKQAVLVSR